MKDTILFENVTVDNGIVKGHLNVAGNKITFEGFEEDYNDLLNYLNDPEDRVVNMVLKLWAKWVHGEKFIDCKSLLMQQRLASALTYKSTPSGRTNGVVCKRVLLDDPHAWGWSSETRSTCLMQVDHNSHTLKLFKEHGCDMTAASLIALLMQDKDCLAELRFALNHERKHKFINWSRVGMSGCFDAALYTLDRTPEWVPAGVHGGRNLVAQMHISCHDKLSYLYDCRGKKSNEGEFIYCNFIDILAFMLLHVWQSRDTWYKAYQVSLVYKRPLLVRGSMPKLRTEE